ncbi:MAG: hypothetical protein Q8M95_09020 [Candidatus Methanoperedens sp.]|nr:hypothetical protein [Candidatus Methanoperedens sp.]
MKKEGSKDKRITARRKKLLEFLPSDINGGKTYNDIAEYVGYSIATVSNDLEVLKTARLIDCTSDRPAKWFTTNKGKINYDGDMLIQL